MRKIPYTHPDSAPNPTTIGGVLLHPGDTRLVDASMVPGARAKAAPAPTAPPAEDDMETLRSDSVKDIVAKLEQLADEQLDELEQLERADDKPRKGVLEGIDEERLRRAAADDEGGGDDGAGEE